MVKCDDCNKQMRKPTTTKCAKQFIVIGDKTKKCATIYKRNTTYFDVNKRCHDCNILNKKGNTHHYGCDIERCPKCKGQLISCKCNKTAILETSKKGVFGTCI
jgi:hypothetical protein